MGKIRNLIKLKLLFAMCLQLAGCQLVAPFSDNASYLKIDNASFVTPTMGYGTGRTSLITDVWVYNNSTLLGTFALPARIPILTSGRTRLQIEAGTFANGIKENRISYPFYKGIDTTLLLETGKEIYFKPTFTYGSNVAQPLLYSDDFEIGIYQFDTANKVGITTNIDTVCPNGGTKSAIKRVSSTGAAATSMLMLQKSYIDLPKDGSNIYLEIDYNTNVTCYLGLFAGDPNNATTAPVDLSDYAFKPSYGWRKAYIYLTDQVMKATNNLRYKFYITAYSVPGQDSYVAVDNIRLVTFQK